MAMQAARRATIYLDPDLHKALRLKAVETSANLSSALICSISLYLSRFGEPVAGFLTLTRE